MSKDKQFRAGDAVGPDYRCAKCDKTDCRLWRETNVFLSCVDLRCAECATEDQAEAIQRYAYFHQPHDPGIGNLVPARPTPDGDTFWGHTSGDVEWWYRLPQWTDPDKEARQIRIERDHFVAREQYALKDWLEERRVSGNLRRLLVKLEGVRGFATEETDSDHE